MSGRKSFSPALLAVSDLVGLGSLQLALLLALIDYRLAAAPLSIYLGVTFAAPFFPRLGYFLPVIARGERDGRRVALTFDDGPHPETTPRLLELLETHGVHATFFVVGQRCEAHPELLEAILAAGHEVGNHTHTHDVALALRSSARLREEVRLCQEVLVSKGVRPLIFRPPVGITNPRLRSVLQEEGLVCVTWSRRARDRGNRRVDGLARRLLSGLPGRGGAGGVGGTDGAGGEILLLHDRPPVGGVDPWLREVDALLSGLASRKLQAVGLSELLGFSVNEPVASPAGQRQPGGQDDVPPPSPVRLFYDRLASAYDAEQKSPSMAGLRRAERRRILDTIGAWEGLGAVLEIGAGSGRFTLELARRAERVLAVDVSPRMLSLLEEKARGEDLPNIQTRVGDIVDLELRGPFSHICAFSSLEYVADLGGLLSLLMDLLEPEGTLYFTTARRSFLRLFAQVGNGLRQGVWLHARTARGLRRDLRRAGYRGIRLSSFGLPYPGGAMLLEGIARRPAGRPGEEAAG